MLLRAWAVFLLALLFSGTVSAESRFGRPVMKLAGDQEFTYVQLDGNIFPVEIRGPISVSCMTYRGRRHYYVEVAISNKSYAPIYLAKGFVEFLKFGYTVFQIDTMAAAQEARGAVTGPYIPAPPPKDTTTTYSATAVTLGNMTTVNGSSHTTDNSGWYALGQAIAARRYYKTQSNEQLFASYLETFAAERQPLTIPPNTVQLYVFTFQQLKPRKKPFMINVHVGTSGFPFSYKE